MIAEPAAGCLTRRALMIDGAGVVASAAAASAPVRWLRRLGDPSEPDSSQAAALRALGRARMRLPDSLPNAAVSAGTDMLPGIEHIVVLMLENHSYDNLFGMLGRGRGQRPRGDGFTLGADGYPTATNPYPDGRPLRAFRMPTTCQLHGKPSQEWKQSHVQWANGRNDGFVISDSGPIAMGYWDGGHLPFMYDLATRFPIGDRWFCSTLAQTDPNRRYLIAATSSGMTDDIGTGTGNVVPNVGLLLPSNGTIFQRLSAAGVSWADYYVDYPLGTTANLYPLDTAYRQNMRPIAQFYTDAAAGTLPAFSLLDPDYGHQSQEDPQNIAPGEALLAKVVTALGASPAWGRTLLIVTYDEHGGYYDHVPPPAALAPDALAPQVRPGQSEYDGFRVPAVLVGPYVKRDHVSHVLYDHTSILALVERKWNLPAMSFRDANANDPTDFIDLEALAAGKPTFPEPPKLAPPGDTAAAHVCDRIGTGPIPPPPPVPALLVSHVGPRGWLHGIALWLGTSAGILTGLTVELHRSHRLVARVRVARASPATRRVVLREHGRMPRRGRYTVTVKQGARTLYTRSVTVR